MARRCFSLVLLFFSCFVTVQSVIYELEGQQVQFDPDIIGRPKQIVWKHNGNKVVEFNGIEKQVFGSYEGRIMLDWDSAQLQISDLRLEDSGKYEYAIYMERNVYRKSYELEVIEKVANPTITCQMNSSSSTVSAVLLCSVELNQPQSSVNFTWISKGNVQHGPQLTIFLGGEFDEKEYTCQVSNLLSSETATFIAKDCYTDTGLSAGWIALIIVIPAVIVCVGLVMLFYRLKQKDSICCTKGRKDNENPRSSEGTRTAARRRGAHVISVNEEYFLQLLGQTGNVTTPAEPHLGAHVISVDEEYFLQLLAQTEVSRTDEAEPAAASDGVTEDMVSHQGSCSAPKHSGIVTESAAPLKKKGLKDLFKMRKGVDEETAQDKERKPLVEDQPTASSPQPQKQLDTENPAAVSDGVTEDMVSHQESCSAPQHTDSEKEDRGAQSDAGGGLPPAAPLTQNSPNVAPQDTDGEDNKDVNVASESVSSRHKNQNKSNDFDNNVQSSTTTEHGGSKQSAEVLRVYPRF